MLGDQFLRVLGFHLHVEGILGQDLYDRSLLAESETSGFDYLDFIRYTLSIAFGYQGLIDSIRFA